jgi:hypothetical protein
MFNNNNNNNNNPSICHKFPSNVSQIFDARLKISNLKLSANGNAGGTLMLGREMPAFGNAENFGIW